MGFALETNDEEMNARLKMEKKNLDFIVLNSLRDAGADFSVIRIKYLLSVSRENRWRFRVSPRSRLLPILSILSAVMCRRIVES